ncbi:hypothetical protein TNCT_530631, partial [Trichonephila clavata]
VYLKKKDSHGVNKEDFSYKQPKLRIWKIRIRRENSR